MSEFLKAGIFLKFFCFMFLLFVLRQFFCLLVLFLFLKIGFLRVALAALESL